MNITYALPKEAKVCDADSYLRLVEYLDGTYRAAGNTIVHDEYCKNDDYYSEAVVFDDGFTRYVQARYGGEVRYVLLTREEAVYLAKEVLKHYGIPFCNRVKPKGGY